MKRLRAIDWKLVRRTPGLIALILLGAAVFFPLIAWQVQAAAARALDEARVLQAKEVPSEDSPPPSTDENLQVLEVLDRSIEIRRDIDGLLGSIEATVDRLQTSQERSQTIAQKGRRQVRGIGENLGGAVGATRSSVRRLNGLRGRLGTSVELARAIAEELEELDRKLGPTVGLKP